MTTLETHRPASGRAARTRGWWVGLLTLVAAVGVPKLNDYVSRGGNAAPMDQGELLWLLGIVVVAELLLFGVLGRWAVQAPLDSGRPARVGLVCSVLGLVGILVFWVSAPILLGPLGATLGYEARQRTALAGHGRMAVAALVIGGIAALTGIVIWLVAP